MKFKHHPEYKDSGVEWIGEIPNNWELTKIGHHTYIKRGAGYQLLNLDKAEKTVECIRINDFHKFNPIMVEYFPELNQYKIKKDDILIAGTGATAGITLHIDDFNEKGYIHSYNVINIRPNSINSKFLFYLMNSELIFIQENMLFTGSAQHFLDIFSIANLKITFPLIDEQEKIVSFLDKKTSEIDLTIEKDTLLIELLKEKRTALINHVVTKGLDPTVKMKDSGVEWIGEIPEDWNFSKIKRYSQILTGGTPSRDIQSYWENGTINWMSSGEINYRRVNFTKEKITNAGLRNSNARILPKNSVMIALNGQGKTKGMVATINISTSCNQSLAAFVCDESNIHFNFIYYFLRNKYEDIRGLVGSNEREGLSLAVIKDIFVPIPPFEAQIEISNYLDEKTLKIDQTVNKIHKNISLLEEYKKSFIHHVVTGKVDVREVAV